MIQSVQRAIRILSILSDNYTKPTPLSTLAALSGLNKSTCAHLIATLEAEGYAIKISPSKGYILGPAAYCLSRFGDYKKELATICHPILQYLHHHTGHTVILAIVENGTKYILDSIDNSDIFDSKTRIRSDDIYRTATGRAILVNLPWKDASDIFKKYGNPTETEWPEVRNIEEFNRYAANIKKNTVLKSRCCSLSDTIVNLGYGAAIFTLSRCVGAVGIALKMSLEEEKNFTQEEETKIIRLLSRGASEINRRLVK